MKLNKLLIIFALVGLLGFMAACGSQDNQKDNNQEAQNNNEEVQNNNQEAENNNEEVENNNEEAENNNEETQDNASNDVFPIVDDEIELKIFAAKSSPNIDWNDNFPVWEKYQDMTNIKVDWVEQIEAGDIEEKRNLAIAGGQLPDAFFATLFNNADLQKYGQQGIFIDLKDLIDEHAPNFKKLMEEVPEIEKGITFPDGNIYALPNVKDVDYLSLRLSAKPWIDQTWLDELDMEIPETTEEFYDYLTAVKEEDPDNAGFGGPNINYLVGAMNGAFGLGNTGSDGGNVDLDPDGDGLRFIPTADKYRQLLDYLHKLYDEELIAKNIFTIEWNQYLSHAEEGNYASVITWLPQDHLTGAIPLEGPDGDQIYSVITSPLSLGGQFVITEENEHPAETIQWIDYFYGDEGSKLMHMGIEDESFVEEDGSYEYSDVVLEAEGVGRPIDKFKEFVPGGGINPPALNKKDYAMDGDAAEALADATEKLGEYIPEEVWPEFTYTEEENDFITSTGNDISKYSLEMRDKFISGDEPLDDKNWEKYIETLEGMNVEEFMKIKEAAYERYSNN